MGTTENSLCPELCSPNAHDHYLMMMRMMMTVLIMIQPWNTHYAGRYVQTVCMMMMMMMLILIMILVIMMITTIKPESLPTVNIIMVMMIMLFFHNCDDGKSHTYLFCSNSCKNIFKC